jgi:hypothetical protein
MCCGWGLAQNLASKRVPLGKLKFMALDVTGLAGLILSGTVGAMIACVCGADAEQAVNSAMHALARKRKKRMSFGVIAVVSAAKNYL